MKKYILSIILLYSLFAFSVNAISDETSNPRLELDLSENPETILNNQANFNLLDLTGSYCQKYCGANNCRCWSTGLHNAGNSDCPISCNNDGKYCNGGTCYDPRCTDRAGGARVYNNKL